VINPIIYAEVSVGFKRIEEVDEILPQKKALEVQEKMI